MVKAFVVRAILVTAAAVVLHGLVLLAQSVTPPGKFIPTEQWQKELAENKPTLGIVAGQPRGWYRTS